MSTRLVVDSSNELKELNQSNNSGKVDISKWPAMVISYLFHPVFIPIYIILYLLYIHPFMFAGDTVIEKRNVLAQAIVNYTVFPIVTLLLIRAAGFISSSHCLSQNPFRFCPS